MFTIDLFQLVQNNWNIWPCFRLNYLADPPKDILPNYPSINFPDAVYN